jgi:hypothetical protein
LEKVKNWCERYLQSRNIFSHLWFSSMKLTAFWRQEVPMSTKVSSMKNNPRLCFSFETPKNRVPRPIWRGWFWIRGQSDCHG